MRIQDIDLYEVNEAFASILLSWLKEFGADPERMNVNGGSIALGHPLGASGTKLMATLIHALRVRRATSRALSESCCPRPRAGLELRPLEHVFDVLRRTCGTCPCPTEQPRSSVRSFLRD
jgi:hypothetical protein